MTVRDNTKAGNSVKQTSSVLHIRGCAHLPLQQVFKIIMSPDSTFYKLHSDIYFAKVLSLAMRMKTVNSYYRKGDRGGRVDNFGFSWGEDASGGKLLNWIVAGIEAGMKLSKASRK